jgi:radical SAM superfamily enzyme YgiQ (UPF0313 family)
MAKVALLAVPLLNTRFPPLNTALLCGELKNHGHTATVFDLNIDAFQAADQSGRDLWDFRNGYKWTNDEEYERSIFPAYIRPHMERWLDTILAIDPDIVGVSVTPNKLCWTLAQELKARRPAVKIIFGGPMCSKVMGAAGQFQPNDVLDAVVHDEGEHTLLDLVRAFDEQGTLPLVPGATVLVGGTPTFGGVRQAIEDLDGTALPDFTDLDLSLYRDFDSDEPARELPIYTSRGCVARCNFCMDYKMWAVDYRQKSTKRVIEELEYLSQTFGVKNFIFIELVFNGHHKWMADFAAQLKARDAGFKFWSHGRIDRRLTPELLRALKEVGFTHFIFGLESASDRVLRLMRKGTSKAKSIANLQDCAEAGVAVSTNIIVGYPGEELVDYLETLAFILRHRKQIWSAPNVTPCYVTPGTDLYEQPATFDVAIDFSDPEAAANWTTTDGRNTRLVRELRKQVMDFFFARVTWQSQLEKVKRRSYRDLRDRLIGAAAEWLGSALDQIAEERKKHEKVAPGPALTKTRRTLSVVQSAGDGCGVPEPDQSSAA